MFRILIFILSLSWIATFQVEAQNRQFYVNNQPSWTPNYLGANLVGWFDGSDTSTVFTDTAGTTKATSGTTVALWKDKSGKAYNASQATAGSRPTLTNRGLVFNGTSSVLVSTMQLSQFTTTNTGSIFAVTKFGSSPSQYAGLVNFRVTGGNDTGLILTSTTTVGLDWSTNSIYTWTAATFTVGATAVAGFVNSGASQIFSYNGTLTTNSTATTAIGTGQTAALYLGQDSSASNRYYSGTLYEVVMVSNNLSTANRQKLEGYLAWKWNIQASLPTAHPYYRYAP